MKRRKKNHFSHWSLADIILGNILFILLIAFLYPFWNVVIQSFNEADDLAFGDVYLWPRKFSLDAYKAVFKIGLFQPFMISLARVVIGII